MRLKNLEEEGVVSGSLEQKSGIRSENDFQPLREDPTGDLREGLLC